MPIHLWCWYFIKVHIFLKPEEAMLLTWLKLVYNRINYSVTRETIHITYAKQNEKSSIAYGLWVSTPGWATCPGPQVRRHMRSLGSSTRRLRMLRYHWDCWSNDHCMGHEYSLTLYRTCMLGEPDVFYLSDTLLTSLHAQKLKTELNKRTIQTSMAQSY